MANHPNRGWHNPRGAPMPQAGLPIDPLVIVRILRWLADLTGAEMVETVQAAANDPELAKWWPELDARGIADLRDRAREMTANRLRQWDRRGERQPTWLEVRALITGLRLTME